MSKILSDWDVRGRYLLPHIWQVRY